MAFQRLLIAFSTHVVFNIPTRGCLLSGTVLCSFWLCHPNSTSSDTVPQNQITKPIPARFAFPTVDEVNLLCSYF